jgi:hypothetical protein
MHTLICFISTSTRFINNLLMIVLFSFFEGLLFCSKTLHPPPYLGIHNISSKQKNYPNPLAE